MKIFRYTIIFFLYAVCTFTHGDESRDRAIAQAGTLIERMKAFDGDGAAALIYTRVFVKLGVDPSRALKANAELNERLKSAGARYSKFELLTADKPFTSDGQLYVILPYSSLMEAQSRRLLSEAFFIGVSEDDGKTWKFVDGISSTQQNIRTIIPSYDGSPLPPRRQKSLP